MKKIISFVFFLLISSVAFAVKIPDLATLSSPDKSDYIYAIDVSDTTDGSAFTAHAIRPLAFNIPIRIFDNGAMARKQPYEISYDQATPIHLRHTS